ncbi:P-loop containing nucleoside triphosphate hydrolase protein [Xylaria nigripes]|nr:P-loop containing nucleoside triphosphate hydrolase protein [Xylaria nigripes]
MQQYYVSGTPLTMGSVLRNIISRLLSKPTALSNGPQASTREPQRSHSQHTLWGPKPPTIIFILGPPGAGKETQSKRLRRDFPGLTHLSYGDLLRYHASIPGSWVSTFPRRGGGLDGDPVLPAHKAVELLREPIQAGMAHEQNIWLVDGFPRTKEQMDAWADAQMPKAKCTLYLECEASVLVDRILSRAATSGRPDDADLEKVSERVHRNAVANQAMLKGCEEYDVPVVRIDTNRELDVVYNDIRTHFVVSYRKRHGSST